jgi:hypothetical protein
MKIIKTLFISILFLFSGTVFTQWETYTIPYSNSSNIYISEPSFPTADVGFVISSSYNGDFFNSKLFKTTNKCSSWDEMWTVPSNSSSNFGVYFIDVNTGFIAKKTTGILPHTIITYKTTNGGYTWNNAGQIGNLNYPVNDLSMDFVNQNTGYLWNGLYIYKTTDGSNNWFQIFNEPTNDFSEITGFAVSRSEYNNIYIGGYRDFPPNNNPVLFKSTNGGDNFIVIENGYNNNSPVHGINSLSLINNEDLYCGSYGGLGKLINNNLELISGIYSNHKSIVKFTNNYLGVIYGELGGTANSISTTSDGGNTWITGMSLGQAKINNFSNAGDVIYGSYRDPSMPINTQSTFITSRKINLYLTYAYDNIPCNYSGGISADENMYNTPDYYDLRGGTIKFHIWYRTLNGGDQIFYKWQNNRMSNYYGPDEQSDYIILSGSNIIANCKTKFKTTSVSALTPNSQVKAVKDTNGTINLLYESMGGIFFTRSTDNGINFFTEENVNYSPTEYSADGNYNPCLAEIKPFSLVYQPVYYERNVAAVWERREGSSIKIRFSERLNPEPAPLNWIYPVDLVTLTNVPENFKANPKLFMVKSENYYLD